MPVLEYYSGGKLRRLNIQPADRLTGGTAPSAGARRTRGGARMAPQAAPLVAAHAVRALRAQADRFGPIFHDVTQPAVLLTVPAPGAPAVLPTPSLIVEGAKKADIAKLNDKFGVEVVDEGSNGKILLRAKEGGEEGIKIAAAAAMAAYKSRNVEAAHPNFIRVMSKIGPSAAGGQPLWNHKNDGNPGTSGADVAALAAWTIAEGKPEIRVAVLDEGVETSHPDLQPAVVAERDFVAGHSTAMPDGTDSHGTACAGIIFGRGKYPGLAKNCSLVAVRIAKGDGAGHWISDDFQTADAIDWAWKEGQADVISNSWGGGPPTDAITRAIDRARTEGRKKKGTVVVFATGNNDSDVSFPATSKGVLAVGASTPWDERKSRTSKDGENWWGSNFGPEISLVAPGVKIATTDINGGHMTNFNGTSSATPHVAAAAALILSVMPSLKEQKVRDIITGSVDRLTPKGTWDKYVGWGRLNIFAALRLATR